MKEYGINRWWSWIIPVWIWRNFYWKTTPSLEAPQTQTQILQIENPQDSRIVDSRLEGKYPPEEAYEVAKIYLQCLRIDHGLRPKMSEVLGVLESL